LQQDDDRGVGEPLNETGVSGDGPGDGLIIRAMHRLSIDSLATAGATRRQMASDLLFRPLLVFAPTPSTPLSWTKSFKASATGLSTTLPPNVHILTAHAQAPGVLLLRVAHMFEVGEDAILSKSVTVSLASLFSGFVIDSATEMSLTNNLPLAKLPITTYNTADNRTIVLPVINAAPAGPTLSVTLSPMQIRTFMCTTH
jgi:hypothetical protein